MVVIVHCNSINVERLSDLGSLEMCLSVFLPLLTKPVEISCNIIVPHQICT